MQPDSTARYSARIVTPAPATGSEQADPGQVHLELTLKLHSYPNPDREPVKILVIGSKRSVNATEACWVLLARHPIATIDSAVWKGFAMTPRNSNLRCCCFLLAIAGI